LHNFAFCHVPFVCFCQKNTTIPPHSVEVKIKGKKMVFRFYRFRIRRFFGFDFKQNRPSLVNVRPLLLQVEKVNNAIYTEYQIKAKQSMQGKAEQNRTEQSRAEQGKARQGKARQGKARQGKARQGKARQGKAEQSITEQSKAMQRKT
jgi:hypothetical protein